jgi:hypothetical protein
MYAPRIFVYLVMFVVALSATSVESKPTAENIGKWPELESLEFKKWKISVYNGNNYPFEEGSKIWSFQTSSGISFQIVAAHPDYWTLEDRNAKRQAFYVVHKDRYYLIEPGSDHEEQLMSKLLDAQARLSRTKKGDPRDLGGVAYFLQNRKPIFNLREQAGGGQSATVPESISEGDKKAQPESEERPQ